MWIGGGSLALRTPSWLLRPGVWRPTFKPPPGPACQSPLHTRSPHESFDGARHCVPSSRALVVTTACVAVAIAAGAVAAAPRLDAASRIAGRRGSRIRAPPLDLGDRCRSGAKGDRRRRRVEQCSRRAPGCGSREPRLRSHRGVIHPSLPHRLALVFFRIDALDLLEPLHAEALNPPKSCDAPRRPEPEAKIFRAQAGPGMRSRRGTRRSTTRSYIPREIRRSQSQLPPLGRVASKLLQRPRATHALPRFALVVPDQCHDMHDCSVLTGDAWSGCSLPLLLRSPALVHSVIFVRLRRGAFCANHVARFRPSG